MPVGVTRQSSPPGAVRRHACASQDPNVSSPSSPRSAWLAFIHTPAGVTDAISASPLLAIDPLLAPNLVPALPPERRRAAAAPHPCAATHAVALSERLGRVLAPAFL